MIDLENPILKEFILESLENLSSISEEMTQYEREFDNPSDPDLIHSIYRKVHTLKGSASFLAFTKLEGLTHSVETILDHFREGTLRPSGEMVDLILESFDCCFEVVKKIEESGSEGIQNYSVLSGKLISLLEHHLLNEKSGATETVVDFAGEILEREEMVTENFKEHTKNEEETKKSESSLEPVSEIEALTKIEIRNVIEVEGLKEEQQQVQKLNPKLVTDPTVRVNVSLLDKILNVVGELVLNRNQFMQLSKTSEEPELNRLSHQLNVITSELQTDIMTTRMQPVGAVFNKFDRIVRDLSRKQDKKVYLDIQGQETELDKTLLEVIRDPLTHLIRNAIDHGIENPNIRKRKGKKEDGLLSIKAYHSGGQVIIEIADDGNGINVERILEKAIGKGIMSFEEAEKCTASKAMNLIFHPGFSTAEKVTNISGRGVGLDVVKSNIEKIGGKCDVSSNDGRGTTFKLNIPLTLAIVPGLIVTGGGETFVIPQKNLVELVLLDEHEFEQIETLYGSNFYRLRGQLIPVFNINDSLKLEKDQEPKNHLNIVVLHSESGTYGLIVDDILDTQEIVVKPLSRKLKSGDIYAGGTIMGDGKVALILDALGFFNMVDKGKGHEVNKENHKHKDSDFKKVFDTEEILLFELDDNRPYGIPLCLISRLEEFHKDNIELSGRQSLIKYRGLAMPLISLNSQISYNGKADLKNKIKKYKKKVVDKTKVTTHREIDSKREKFKKELSGGEQTGLLPCVVSSIGGHNFGFMVDRIVDIARTDSKIEQDNQGSSDIMGTAYVNDHLVTIVDIHKIIEKLNLSRKKVQAESAIGRILVVEDSTLYQRILQEALESQGYLVTIAENGRIGLSFLEDSKNNFDVVITDIEMPEMNGFELVERVRSCNNKFKNIPIIAVTTRVSELDLQKSSEIGINVHLQKLSKELVIETVGELLEA
ncbi:MAG: response regulator [Bacteriovoracaceae bacterium]|jgi:two-component system, chemotaxis family, sensor kinase CheA|nr:response regulator [Bacteriovoracaceae bacterium]